VTDAYAYYVKIEHDFGYFLDPKHYAPLLSVNDESARLILIFENHPAIIKLSEPEQLR
jgi:hypothetical protein